MTTTPYRQKNWEQYRVSMPRAERRHPWLAYLFDLYAEIDASVAAAFDFAERVAPGIPCGCGKGCHGCCHQTIPVTPLEVAGLAWYVNEEMPQELRSALAKKPLARGPGGITCPFLLGGTCAAYPVRPIACRRFLVMRRACEIGEDPVKTRPQDILIPSRPAMLEAFAHTAPYYEALGDPIPENGNIDTFMQERTVVLSTVRDRIFGN